MVAVTDHARRGPYRDSNVARGAYERCSHLLLAAQTGPTPKEENTGEGETATGHFLKPQYLQS